MRKFLVFLGLMLMGVVSIGQNIKVSADQLRVDQIKQYRGTYGYIDIMSDVQIDSNLTVSDTLIVEGIAKYNNMSSIIDISDGEDITSKLNTYLASNRTLYLPSGTYVISGDITIPLSNTKIILS